MGGARNKSCNGEGEKEEINCARVAGKQKTIVRGGREKQTRNKFARGAGGATNILARKVGGERNKLC